MTTLSANVSVIAPIESAIERVKQILFRPFNLYRWINIGFCAWLACLGEGGGSNINNLNPSRGSRAGTEQLRQGLLEVKAYVLSHLYWIVPVVITLFIIGLAVGFLIQWLNSRGKFMFLHSVAHNSDEVAAPWKEFAPQGNSLFIFRAILGLLGMTLILPLVIYLCYLVFNLFISKSSGGSLIQIGLCVLALLPLGLVFGLVSKFTADFVVPIMYLRGSSCVVAWREFLPLLTANIGRFILYLLFQLVIGIATGLIILVAFVVTCCIACCLMMIPFVGTVLILPLLVFQRAYSLYYFRQYGDQFNVFTPPTVPDGGLTA